MKKDEVKVQLFVNGELIESIECEEACILAAKGNSVREVGFSSKVTKGAMSAAMLIDLPDDMFEAALVLAERRRMEKKLKDDNITPLVMN